MKKIILFVPMLLLLMFGLILVLKGSNLISSQSNTIQVVAGENFYGDIVKQLGGSYVSVTSILVDPNVDPHAYEANTQDALAISKAQIVIKNGVGYDTFIDRMLSASGTKGKTILDGASIAGVATDANPHIWYSQDNIKKIAAQVTSVLVHIDAAHTTYFNDKYSTFVQSLNPIFQESQLIKDTFGGTQVIATERVADYLLEQSGLTIIANEFQKAVEEGNDPSVQSINDFESSLTSGTAKVLIYNTQTVSQITERMKTIAMNQNISVVGMSETMPVGKTYQSWMLGELKNLENVLSHV